MTATFERAVSVAERNEDFDAAAQLCEKCFPVSTAAQHAGVLREPGSLANVFFDVRGPASVATLTHGADTLGVVQLVPCAVRAEASPSGEAVGRRVFWVQCLCVAHAARRTGAARQMMAWCEAEAAEAARVSGADAVEVWLAVHQDNAAADGLYRGLGFEASDPGGPATQRSHFVLRKAVPAASAKESGREVGSAARYDVLGGGQFADSGGTTRVSLSALGREIAPQAFTALVAVFGASALVAPFAYAGQSPNPATAMFRDLLFSGNAPLEVGLGLASAAGALALARALGGEKDSERDLVTRLSSDGSLAAQTAGLWRLSGGATAPPTEALAAVAAWQFTAAVAEELYYRGLLQNGAGHGLGALGALPPVVCEGLALFLSTALFALVHAGWVEEGDYEDANARRVAWITEVAPYGLLLGSLFLATDHGLVAPIVAHAALNTYWDSKSLQELRTAPRNELAALFAGFEQDQSMFR